MEKKKILLVENDPDILEILNIVFKEDGYEVVHCKPGKEAFNIQITKPNLILMDITPTNDEDTGATICFELKSRRATRAMPIILLSAEDDLRMIAELCGADAYIRKPFDVDYLRNKVRQLIA